MWHPVGPLPSRVYWRRRLVVLTTLLAVLGGGTFAGIALVRRADAGAETEAAPTSRPARVPALDRVVPTLASVATPSPAVDPPAEETARTVPAGPRSGDLCTDDMVEVTVRAPRTAAVGSKPTFELVVRNMAEVPCVRALDKELQEMQLHDAGGTRVWGSNDCFPESSDDVRTLAPGEAVRLPLVWGGLMSAPGCPEPRVAPGPGAYQLRGRLDTKVTPPAPLTLT